MPTISSIYYANIYKRLLAISATIHIRIYFGISFTFTKRYEVLRWFSFAWPCISPLVFRKSRQWILHCPTRNINKVGAITVRATLKDFISNDFDDNGTRMAKDLSLFTKEGPTPTGVL